MTITDKLIVGDTLDFEDSFPDFPSTIWTLKYRLIPRFATPTQAPIDITADPYQSTDYRVQVGNATTATWIAGAYNWARWVEQLGMRVSLGEGEIQLLEDPAQRVQGYSGTDSRSHARRMLASIELALESLNMGMQSYAIGSRVWTAADKSELIELHDRYLAMVNDENAAEAVGDGRMNPRVMKVRISRAS